MKPILVVVLLSFLCLSQTDAQWDRSNPHGGAGISRSAGGPKIAEPNTTDVTNLNAGCSGPFCSMTRSPGTWTAVNAGLTNLNVRAFAVCPNTVRRFEAGAGGDHGQALFVGTYGGGVFRSTNNGNSWTAVNAGLTNAFVNALAIVDTVLFAGSYGGGIFRSTNNGTDWTSVNSGLTNTYVLSVVSSPACLNSAFLFAGTYYGGVYLSTDNGTSWTAVNSGLTHPFVDALAVSTEQDGSKIFAGTLSGAFLSTNNGASWTPVNSGLTYGYVNALAISPDGVSPEGTIHTTIFAGTNGGGIFLSTNCGTSWSPSGLTKSFVRAFAVSSAKRANDESSSPVIAAAANGRGVFLSTNNGASWSAVNSGLANLHVQALSVSPDGSGGTYLLAGTSGGVWRRSFAEMASAVQPSAENQPAQFSLEQNYPNPFNPTTSMEYGVDVVGGQWLVASSHVRLAVYDMLGREVAVLVDEHKDPGKYTATWNAAGMASGVYVCRLATNDYTQCRTMLLLK